MKLRNLAKIKLMSKLLAPPCPALTAEPLKFGPFKFIFFVIVGPDLPHYYGYINANAAVFEV